MTAWCTYVSDITSDFYATLLRPGLRNLPWDPYRDLPALDGRVVLITGPTSGIGLEAVRSLCLSGAKTLFLLGRSEERLAKTMDTLKEVQFASGQKHSTRIIPVACDLSSIKSVRAAVRRVQEEEEVLDILLANAGISGGSGYSEDGYELQFATNCLGHHILIQELLPNLRRAAKLGLESPSSVRNAETTRVVITSSGAHTWCPEAALSDLASPGSYNKLTLYSRSKLGNIYTVRGLERFLASSDVPEDRAISVAAIHPGGIVSDLGRESAFYTRYLAPLIMWPVAPWGIVTQLWAATAAKREEMHGAYLIPWCTRSQPSTIGRNDQLVDKVWSWCEEQRAKTAPPA
ncbi:short-chain alcohol dehydrogenase [Tilletia horrida]|uniref:Short-chain alcohol dehydrogenase n=1 Tax=Tilletia horrida TaxID=155126 RepID=A0AAN6JQB9_9BASI|nr:short-chain alcohol dehydrogenase [Tilletia horrida]KAK0551870.1 short-chain alcohol dehydrogenase [Tilletia horrida]KAK0563513.1 short-chain alcohol dehydrogenase [Tilletia horrida]